MFAGFFIVFFIKLADQFLEHRADRVVVDAAWAEINFRVENLDELLNQLRAEGVTVDDKREESEFGKFGWIMDPEGTRIELWEPPPVEEKP